LGDLDHVRLPLLAETNLEHHKVVEVVCSLKDIHETIDAALLTSCPSGILQVDNISQVVLIIEVKVIIQVILETADIYIYYIARLNQCDLLISQDFGFSSCASYRK
jgi:hypothetical protein